MTIFMPLGCLLILAQDYGLSWHSAQGGRSFFMSCNLWAAVEKDPHAASPVNYHELVI